jgi:hypothetical protein
VARAWWWAVAGIIGAGGAWFHSWVAVVRCSEGIGHSLLARNGSETGTRCHVWLLVVGSARQLQVVGAIVNGVW